MNERPGWPLEGLRREHLGSDHALEVGAHRVAGDEDQGVAVPGASVVLEVRPPTATHLVGIAPPGQ